MIELKNEYVQVKIASKGAELQSFFDLKKGRERLWQADDTYWGKHAPILFPIVGNLKEGAYWYEGEKYTLPRHGFARDQEFKVSSVTEVQAVFVLTETPDSMTRYPFYFKLTVTYQLCAKQLLVTYKVENTSDKEMFFSIGAHPAFNCDLESESHFLEIKMKRKADVLDCLKIEPSTGLILGERKSIALEDRKLRLTPQLFDEDALIFKGEEICGFILNFTEEGDILKVECENYPYIGIWSPKAPFVCIEPWFGVADFKDTSQQLREKHGIVKLEGHSEFNCKYSIELAE